MGKRILVRENGDILNLLWEDNRIIECSVDRDDVSFLGQICVGKVKNIVQNIRAAFVEVNGVNCYYALDKNPLPIFAKSAKEGVICKDDEIVVQVTKEAVKTKDPTVESAFQLNGRYVVLIHGNRAIHFSTKIDDEKWRDEMKMQVNRLLDGQTACTLIIRTNAYRAETDAVLQEISDILAQYQNILNVAPYRPANAVLYSPLPDYVRTVRDTYSQYLEEIVTDDEEIYGVLKQVLAEYGDSVLTKLRFYEDTRLSLRQVYRINLSIEKALKEKVWLDSGAYLVIQQTEALCAIDVNTGKAISGRQSTEDNFFEINMEAAREIMLQIRLRNLSGMILVDFMNMKDDARVTQLLDALQQLAKRDPVTTMIVDMTKLGLVEITRKKRKKPLSEQLASGTADK